MSYSIDPDPERSGEVNVFFELMKLAATRISTLKKGGWLPQK